MKQFIQIFCSLAALALTALGDPPPADPTKKSEPDPVVGHWIWPGNLHAEVLADGTAVAAGTGRKGKWQYMNNKQVERKYTFVWQGGESIQQLSLSRDKNTLQGKDVRNGNKLVVRRALNDDGKK